jgi:hypothetical protein
MRLRIPPLPPSFEGSKSEITSAAFWNDVLYSALVPLRRVTTIEENIVHLKATKAQ